MFDDTSLTNPGEPLTEDGICPPSPPARAVPPVPRAEAIELLMLRVCRGDHRAFRHLYDATAPRLLAKAMSVLGSRDAAEDALQEAFVRIWNNARQFDPARGTASAWIMRVLRNAAIDRLRQDRHIARYQCGEDLPETPIAPEPVLDRLDLERSLAQLTPEQRTTICRVIVQGWTHDEVGLADQVPTPTAKARARRGLMRLRSVLTDPDGDSKMASAWTKAVA
ncbi:RNA polymerase sigma factor [Novosphingobium sp.]|uniref:RNA polymerase sigma factor n=1 Tax=Novosphingobium sp. TaxID=1874826 RepID=UPI003BAD16E3